MKDETAIRGQAHQDTIHDSAIKHVTGRADYTDDLAEPHGLLHAYLGLSQCAHGLITGMDFSETLASPGVVGVLTAEDIPGVNARTTTRSLRNARCCSGGSRSLP